MIAQANCARRAIRTVSHLPRHDDRYAHVTHRKTMFNRNDLTQKHFDRYVMINSSTMYLAIVRVSVNSKKLAFFFQKPYLGREDEF